MQDRNPEAFWDWMMQAHMDLLGAEDRLRSGGLGAGELATSAAEKTLRAIAGLTGVDPAGDLRAAVPSGWQVRSLHLPLLRAGRRALQESEQNSEVSAQLVREARLLWDAVFWDQEQHGTDMDVED